MIPQRVLSQNIGIELTPTYEYLVRVIEAVSLPEVALLHEPSMSGGSDIPACRSSGRNGPPERERNRAAAATCDRVRGVRRPLRFGHV